MLPITLGATSFKFGPFDIAYGDVFGAGIGVQRRRLGTYHSLMIGYRLAGDPKPRKIIFRLDSSPGHQKLVDDFRARVADRWKGEADFFDMNKRLGFSNKVVFGIVALLVIVAFGITAAALASGSKHDNDPRRPASTQAPRR